jgi:hypothetical protein
MLTVGELYAGKSVKGKRAAGSAPKVLTATNKF